MKRFIQGWDFISNEETLAQANLPSMYELLIQKNLRWAGHVLLVASNLSAKTDVNGGP